MNRDYKKTVINLKNANAKQAYEEEYLDILNNIKDVFASAQYSYDSELPIYMANLKKEINTYKTLRKELVSMKGITSNPFAIPAQETASVESDIIDFQKILTGVMGKALDKYDSSDFKEMGKENISAEGSFGKIDISIEKYTSILSLLTRSQEADMTAKATFTLNLPGSYEYNETTDDYEQTPGKTVSGDLSIDGSMKMIDRDMYLTLRDYSFNIDLPETERVSIDEFLKNLAQYKGKTVKISIPSSESTTKLSSAEMLSQLKKVLMVLDTNSLLTPYKKIGDTYTLTLKESTIESISTIYDQKMPSADIVQAKKEMRKMPLLYTTASGKSTLFVRINENNANGMASLSKQDGEYSFLLDTKNPKNSSESMHLLVKKDLVEGKIQSSGINISIDYKNRTLSLTGEGYMQTVKIE